MSATTGSFYVMRTKGDSGRVSWTGPIRGAKQAHREAEAWTRTGEWVALVEPSTPEVRAAVRAWVKAKRQASR